RRLTLVQEFKLLGPQLDFARFQFGVDRSLGAARYPAGHLDDEFAAQPSGELLHCRTAFGIEDDLGLAVSVSQVNEQHPAHVAVGVDPATERRFLACIATA